MATVSGLKSWGGTDELVHAYDFTRTGGNLDLATILDAFVPPRTAMGFAVGATWTSRRIDCGKLRWNKSRVSHQTKGGKTEMTKKLMIDSKAVSFVTL